MPSRRFAAWAPLLGLLGLLGCTGSPPAQAGGARAPDGPPAVAGGDEDGEGDEADGAADYLRVQDVVGSWEVVKGGDWEEITLDKDGHWSSFLHARPADDGTWKIVKRSLVLSSRSLPAVTFTGVERRGDTLVGRVERSGEGEEREGEGDEGGVMEWKRIQP